jgi:hypothetical protein
MPPLSSSLAERIVDGLLASDPALASSCGDHRYDEALPITPEAVAARVAMLRMPPAHLRCGHDALTRRTR